MKLLGHEIVVGLMPAEVVILLAEDSESDVLLIQRAFRQAYILNPMYVVRNGDEAISYLAGEGLYADRALYPMPSLLLLDIDMPVKDGFEVLIWVRKQPHLKSLRVLMLTSTNRIADVSRAYQLGANSFFVKPFDFQNLIELSRALREHWLGGADGPSTPLDAAAA